MDVNKIQIKHEGFVDRDITIPIQLNWDYLGLDQSIEEYEGKIIEEVVGLGGDFEVDRFPNAPFVAFNPATNSYDETTDIQYEFNFYSGGSLSAPTNWSCNYMAEGFTTDEIFYFRNNFSNSFFKLDFYDNVDEKRQTNYLTIIIPTQQGLTMDAIMQRTPVKIKKPYFVLDYVGDKEGFFIYWLKKRNFLDISTFYMTAKFYDAKKGFFVKMMNVPQSSISGDKFSFDNTKYFYYRVQLNYEEHNYRVFNMNPYQNQYAQNGLNQRAGVVIPIKWYEYVNP
jgi:hypothetical protein